MRVVIMPDAESQLATRRAWWRENRPATKDLFDQELAVAIGRYLGRGVRVGAACAGGAEGERVNEIGFERAEQSGPDVGGAHGWLPRVSISGLRR
jgi:hypothetical protein